MTVRPPQKAEVNSISANAASANGRPREAKLLLNKTSNATAVSRRAAYALTRIDDEKKRMHCWAVRIQRKGEVWNQNFSDLSFGGKVRAYRAACAFRDQILSLHAPMTRAEFARIKKKNNRSGIPGVCRVKCSDIAFGKPVERHYWVAFWATAEGGKCQRKFSIDRYGEQSAFKRAIKARREALFSLEEPINLGVRT
jgi:hypothetical protein